MTRPAPRRTALAAAVLAALVAAAAPEPAAQGIGDRLYPHLGNPGYDVQAYDIALRYSGDNAEPLRAVTTVRARATAPLDRFNLDFARGTVTAVRVNGAPAAFSNVGEDLAVTPAEPVPEGAPLHVGIAHTSDPGTGADGGWVRTDDGLAMANQADAAHRVFPCNDHPSDKAVFTFRVTAPRDLTVVAGGLRPARRPGRTTTTWEYRGAHPMATELAQVSIGRSAVLRRRGPHGLPVRDVVPVADRGRMERWAARTPGQIAWMERQVGRYPFETYGLLVAGTRTGFELETQTLSLFERRLFTDPRFTEAYVESVMVHELAHQWFGDSVSPARWSDVWLSESHATWYEARWAEERAGVPLAERMRRAYAQSDAWRAASGPPAAPKPPEPGQKIGIFRPVVYDGSALVLYALRQRIGPAAFDRLERTWAGRYRDGHAATADFVALASEVSGRDQSGFLRPWLYGARTPAMPGHPDWRTGPAAPAARPGARHRAGKPV
ncbi:M1 family metallopeptidase [Streptomyces sp. NPDC002055]|uniref:M1 family metallopeptidase n=1 Tax=Streptomyces sp. NPDC002055 TaxID=3154534 RepID=UPI0033272E65